MLLSIHGEGHLFDTMNPDGSIKAYDPNETGTVIYFGYEENTYQKTFEFETENNAVKSVTFLKSGQKIDNMYFRTMTEEEINLVCTALLSTPGCTLAEYIDIIKLLEENQSKQEADIQYRDKIRIQWKIETSNCIPQGTYYITENAGKPSSIYYSFTVHFE